MRIKPEPVVEISNQKIIKFDKQIANLHKRIKAEQEVCQHEDVVLSTYNNHDGYSFVTVTWYETRKCKKCGRVVTVETGTSGPGY